MKPGVIALAAILLPSTFGATSIQARDCAEDGGANLTRPISLPETSVTVMIDGVLSPGEWDGAITQGSPATGTVQVKRSGSHLYVAVAFPEAATGFVDLFVTACEATYALHASAKLGERQVIADPVDWIWWNNVGWVANTTRVDSFEDRTFLAAPAREFQIALSKFPARRWGLRMELTSTRPDGRPTGSISIPTAGEWVLDVGQPASRQP